MRHASEITQSVGNSISIYDPADSVYDPLIVTIIQCYERLLSSESGHSAINIDILLSTQSSMFVYSDLASASANKYKQTSK